MSADTRNIGRVRRPISALEEVNAVHDVRQSGRKMLVLVWLISLAALVLAAGCGDDSNDTGGEAEANVVTVSHSSFLPNQLKIDAGDTVTFRNVVDMSHPLVSEEAGLDTGEFPKGDRSFTFDVPGIYTITNTAHANIMNVTVR
jgi:plastocyanin